MVLLLHFPTNAPLELPKRVKGDANATHSCAFLEKLPLQFHSPTLGTRYYATHAPQHAGVVHAALGSRRMDKSALSDILLFKQLDEDFRRDGGDVEVKRGQQPTEGKKKKTVVVKKTQTVEPSQLPGI